LNPFSHTVCPRKDVLETPLQTKFNFGTKILHNSKNYTD
jgi:hypothetical protein